MGQPLVSMLCHRGPVTSVAVDNQVRIREERFVSPGKVGCLSQTASCPSPGAVLDGFLCIMLTFLRWLLP
jgi:hypothetical protein